MSYSNELDSNNKDLQTILETINNLPEAGGSSGPCSWNDLTDKPFGYVIPEPIVWDGVIGDGYLVDLGVGGFRFYRISEGYISKDDAYGGQFKVIATDNGRVDLDDPINDEWAKNGSEYGFTDPNTWYIDGLGLPLFLAVNTKETIVESFTGENIELTFEPGLYVFKSNTQHLSSVVFPSQIKKIDEKYLPDTIPNAEEVQQMINEAGNIAGGGSQSDWNENDETSASYVQNRTHYSEIVQELLFAETGAQVDGLNVTTDSGDKCYIDYVIFSDENENYAPLFTIEFDKTYIVTYDSIEYRLTPFRDIYGIYVGRNYDGAATPEEAYPFTIGYYPDYPGMELAMYELGTHTISVSSEEEAVYKLDAKYVPNAIQGDWNESDTSSLSYIKNKPFGLFLGKKIQTTCDITVPAEDLSEYSPGVYKTPDYKYAGEFWIGDFTYEVIIDGVSYYTQAVDGYSNFDYLGSFDLTSNPDEAEFPFLIYRDGQGHILIYFTTKGPHTVKIVEYAGGYELVKIDPKFLPDNIGGGVTSEEVQQMINDALGVIENGSY